MMGNAMYSCNVPVTKITSAMLGFLKDEAAVEESPCIRCGKCAQVCPSRLQVYKLAALAERNDDEGFVKLYGMECCGCGSCSYICPAKRNLAQNLVRMRKSVLQKNKKNKA